MLPLRACVYFIKLYVAVLFQVSNICNVFSCVCAYIYARMCMYVCLCVYNHVCIINPRRSEGYNTWSVCLFHNYSCTTGYEAAFE